MPFCGGQKMDGPDWLLFLFSGVTVTLCRQAVAAQNGLTSSSHELLDCIILASENAWWPLSSAGHREGNWVGAKLSPQPLVEGHRIPRVNTMARKTSKYSAKIAKQAAAKGVAAKPTLLAGGNPQIAKADGDAPVQAYIAAMPGWKRDVGRCLDALIVRTVPGVQKAVKWNSPLYGVAGQGWFLGFHCLTKYVKVAFFRGTSLHPVPSGESKSKETRYLHIHEEDRLDEAQLAAWVKQASQLPGERL
jgi:hypothetical protein